LGGIIAQGGFDYQLWDGLVRLPSWLSNPAFEGMIFEGLEDLEARFFAPQAPRGRLLERYQAKSGNMQPAEVIQVFESFRAFDAAYPQLARVQTLVTPKLTPSLAWLGRDPARVRRARPFYAPFDDVAQASDEQLRSDLIAQIGALGDFVADSVEVAERNLPDRAHAVAAFGAALVDVFPPLNPGQRQVAAAFDDLAAFIRQSPGVLLDRDTLVRRIEASVGAPLFSSPAFPLHIRSDRNGSDERALEIDARAFAGGALPFPAADVWGSGLLAPLERTASWLRSRDISRIALGGSYRLTTGFAIGHAFRSAIGFEIEIPTRSGAWPTDERAVLGHDYPSWTVVDAEALDRDRLVVAVGVVRDPAADILKSGLAPPTAILAATMSSPIPSADAAQAAVAAMKRSVDATAARLRPKRIDLFLAGPAAVAVALGHRWNAMPPTQLFEFIAADRRYVATAML
jgi:hypothetical protein